MLPCFLADQSRKLALACAVAGLGLLAPPRVGPARSALNRLPRVILWAWERPEDLRGVDAGVGVAFLAQTITVADARFVVQPRRQPLRVAPRSALVAVTRIQVPPSTSISLRAGDIADLASAIADTATLPRVVGLQVDFDAAASERSFYRELLGQLRERLDPGTPLSITALASWCMGDPWLRDLPVDEAVPMLFRMGPANQPFQKMAASGEGAQPECQRAVGTSLDEPLVLRAGKRRVYVFNPKPWTALTVAEARRQADR